MSRNALVIDDSRPTADALCEMLELLGFAAQPAYGPRAALMLVGQERPDIVFLDINMPGVDGFEVLAYLRREPELALIPVVVVTSDDQPETAQRARQGQAVDILIKPLSLESLESVLKKANLLE